MPMRSLLWVLWVHTIPSIATQHWKYSTAEISTHFVCHMHVSANVQISSAYVYTYVHTRACELRAAHIPLNAQLHRDRRLLDYEALAQVGTSVGHAAPNPAGVLPDTLVAAYYSSAGPHSAKTGSLRGGGHAIRSTRCAYQQSVCVRVCAQSVCALCSERYHFPA
jgi:hypothetical protein